MLIDMHLPVIYLYSLQGYLVHENRNTHYDMNYDQAIADYTSFSTMEGLETVAVDCMGFSTMEELETIALPPRELHALMGRSWPLS